MKFKKPTLTIGIPTYNRKNYLEKLLDNAVSQIKKDNIKEVIILISDNNSEDGTEQLIKKKYLKKYSFIKYHKNNKNVGGGGNIVKLVELASTDYLWFMGDDDNINEAGIKNIKEKLGFPEKIYMLNSIYIENGKKAYYKNEKNDEILLGKKDKEKIKKLYSDWGLLTNTVLPVKKSQKIIKKQEINKYWAHLELCFVLLFKENINIKIIANPTITLRDLRLDKNLVWLGFDPFYIHLYEKSIFLRKIGKETDYIIRDIFSFRKLIKYYFQYSLFSSQEDKELLNEIFKKEKRFFYKIRLLPFFFSKIIKIFIKMLFLIPSKKTKEMKKNFQERKKEIEEFNKKVCEDKAIRRVYVKE